MTFISAEYHKDWNRKHPEKIKEWNRKGYLRIKERKKRVFDEAINNYVMQMEEKREDLAYLAGIIDGEGYIGLCLAKDKRFKKKPNLRPVVTISNTNLELLNWINNTFKYGSFSFSLREDSRQNSRCKTRYRLECASRLNSLKILKAIFPHLKIKKSQANLVIEFLEKHEYGKYTEQEWEIYWKLRKINKRGV